MKVAAFIGAVVGVTLCAGSFLQCSPSDSLESLDELSSSADIAAKQGVICERWPFYSGGFGKHDSSDSVEVSLPANIASDSVVQGYQDKLQTVNCVEASEAGVCLKWVSTKQETIEHAKKSGGCTQRIGDDDEPAISLLTEYELCVCADGVALSGSYCSNWACLETDAYPSDFSAYSLMVDNSFVMEESKWFHGPSDSDSSSESSDSADEELYHGDYYRFVKNDSVMALQESMEFQNCWCKAPSANGAYCLNWYCESLAHDEFGCHKQGFGVDDYGWFACYEDSSSSSLASTMCSQWYGFLVDHEQRNEYRCECTDEACVSWVCGVEELPVRQNWRWYNFPLAIILWVCLCGCCGTKICYKHKFIPQGAQGCGWLQCRKFRMFVFLTIFGVVALMHGGVPAFLFFILVSSCSLCCAYKCENCKCCRSHCSRSKCNTAKTATTAGDTDGRTDTKALTEKTGEADGENSVSAEHDMEMGKATKTGHVRVTSVDLDEVDDDKPDGMDGPQV